jgi:tetratricopeptide (TPR) repeat protein
MKRIRDMLTRLKTPVEIQDTEFYKRLTIRINHMGVSVRDTEIGAKIGTKSQFRVRAGDFILSKIDARQGAFGIVPHEADGGIITGNFWTYRVDNQLVDTQWFLQFTNSDAFLDLCKRSSTGNTHRKYLNEDIFLNHELAIPSLEKQRKAVVACKAGNKSVEEIQHEITHQQSLLAKLKQAILQEAIQGKLTADWRAAHPDVEPASQLLHRIQAEKARLIAAKKLRPEKPLPKITPAEIPFENPKGWVSARLGDMAAPRIDAFARYMGKAAKILDDSQGLFASFQAERHRFGAARVHLLRLLRTAPDCNPARLPAIPLLDPLLREFQAQFDESPDAFALLVHRQSPGLTPEEVAGLPPINRRSGTAALLLGNGHFERDRYEEAIQAFSECAKIWPWDATPLLNLVRALVETGRLKDATEVIAAIRPQALSTELKGKLERNVAEGWWAEDIYEGPREIPLPEFGGFYPGANREFLDSLDSLRRKSETPAKSPQPTRRRRQTPSPSRA